MPWGGRGGSCPSRVSVAAQPEQLRELSPRRPKFSLLFFYLFFKSPPVGSVGAPPRSPTTLSWLFLPSLVLVYRWSPVPSAPQGWDLRLLLPAAPVRSFLRWRGHRGSQHGGPIRTRFCRFNLAVSQYFARVFLSFPGMPLLGKHHPQWGAQVGDPHGLAQPEPQPVVLCRHGVTRWMDPPGRCMGAERGPEEPNLYISIKKPLKPSLEGPGGLEQLVFPGEHPRRCGRGRG